MFIEIKKKEAELRLTLNDIRRPFLFGSFNSFEEIKVWIKEQRSNSISLKEYFHRVRNVAHRNLRRSFTEVIISPQEAKNELLLFEKIRINRNVLCHPRRQNAVNAARLFRSLRFSDLNISPDKGTKLLSFLQRAVPQTAL